MRFLFIVLVTFPLFMSCTGNGDFVPPKVGCDCDPDDINFVALSTNDTVFFNTAISPNYDANNEYWSFYENTENALYLMDNMTYKVYDNRGGILVQKTGKEIWQHSWDAQNVKSGCYRYEIYYNGKIVIDDQYLKINTSSLTSTNGGAIAEYEGCGCKILEKNDVKLLCND